MALRKSKSKRIIPRFLINFPFLIILLFKPYSAAALPSVTIYGTGIYSDSSVDVSLYITTGECDITSYGVKLSYNSDDLTVVSAIKNEAIWYFGDGITNHPYIDPDIGNPNEIIFIGGKLDTHNATVGVNGDGILIAQASFTRNNSNFPILSLSFGKNGSYKNFVTPNQLVLDDQQDGVVFDDVDMDFDTDNDGTPDDIDGCPSDPYKTTPGICGCGTADTDTDSDGIPDCNDMDDDNDGLSDAEEGIYYTDIHNPDTDGDDMPDGWEVNNDLNPLVDDANADPDNDGFINLFEYRQGTDPNDPYSHPSQAMPWLPLLLE